MNYNWDQFMDSAEEAYHGGLPIKAQKLWILAVKEAEEAQDLRRASLSLDRMAEALRQAGSFADAEAVLIMALEVKESMYGHKHSEVISSLNNLVDAMHAQNKYDEALAVVQRLIDAYELTFGADHPGVASIASNMAAAYHEKGHPAAEDFYKQAIAIKTKSLGYRHDETLALTARYAAWLLDVGREAEAKDLQTASAETVSGVWKTVAQKMNERMSDKLSEPKLSQKRFDRKREPRT
jgi:tetratricopeptide (TPR) repeat protein